VKNIIWNCANAIEESKHERATMQTVEKYCNEEFKGVMNHYESIDGVNEYLHNIKGSDFE